MSISFRERAIILVKAFPQPSQRYEETVCCAGITPEGAFVRLYPIRYRHLRKEQQFDRWDVIEYQATRPHDDWRPESRHVDEESIRIVQQRGQFNDEQRVRVWMPHISQSLVVLREENVATHKSLGIIRPDDGTVRFHYRRLDLTSADDRDLQAAFKQVSLLDESFLTQMPVEFEFSYRFECVDNHHEMKIHDWEVQAAYLSYRQRYGNDALIMLCEEYEKHIPSRNLHLVMGTMKAHPRQFIIIGLLRSGLTPADAARQPQLL